MATVIVLFGCPYIDTVGFTTAFVLDVVLYSSI